MVVIYMRRLRVGGIVDLSTVDWYGNVSLVVFLSGCNFRCPYCQNMSLVRGDYGEDLSLDALRKRIEVNISLLDSVVFSGGEPLLQRDGLMEALEMVRSLGLKTMIETNGSLPEVVESLLQRALLDRVALDVKAPLEDEVYGRVIGVPALGGAAVNGVKKTLKICRGFGVEVEARTTVVPKISDEPWFIRDIASSIRELCVAYQLQQFDNLGDILSPELKMLTPPSRESMLKLAEEAVKEGVKEVYVKTRELGLERIKWGEIEHL
ncbi:MAG: anaerobic ribonucleoside-triphosphate reductase activating protein [Candidatus Bathyarchaeia archaeon]